MEESKGSATFSVEVGAERATLRNNSTKESVVVSLVEGGATLQITLLSATDNKLVDTIQNEGTLDCIQSC